MAIVGIVVLAVVLLGSAAWWFLWVPTWRPSLRSDERFGVDVSSHQGAIDWTRVASDSITFAYIKASEGGDFVDARFDENWRGADDAELDRGAYHFFTLCRPGSIQAAHFLASAPPDPDALPPAVDLELAGNCRYRPSRSEVQDELLAFIRPVEEAWSQDVVLYLGDDFESAYDVTGFLHRPLWLRRFLVRPRDEWFIWQLHGYAHVEGIEGPADLDVMRIDRSP